MQKHQYPAHKVGGEFSFDGDKSISHRLVLISALLKYEICLSNLSRCEDVKTSLKAVQKLVSKSEKSVSSLTLTVVKLSHDQATVNLSNFIAVIQAQQHDCYAEFWLA